MPEKNQSQISLIRKYNNSSEEAFLSFWENMKKNKQCKKQSEGFDYASEYEALQGKELLHLVVNVSEKMKIETMVAGHRYPVLLLSGFGHAAPLWKNQFEQLFDSYQMIHMNPPAIGLSESSKEFTMEEIVDAMERALDILGVTQPVFILASSWGGTLAQIMAYKYPTKVKALLLADCFYQLKTSVKNPVSLSKQLLNDFQAIGMEEQYQEVNRYEAVNQLKSRSYAKYVLNGFDVKEYTEKFSIPALIIHGEKDSFITYESARELYEMIPNAEFATVDGAGHMPNFTHPQEYNVIITHYMAEQLEDELEDDVDETM